MFAWCNYLVMAGEPVTLEEKDDGYVWIKPYEKGKYGGVCLNTVVTRDWRDASPKNLAAVMNNDYRVEGGRVEVAYPYCGALVRIPNINFAKNPKINHYIKPKEGGFWTVKKKHTDKCVGIIVDYNEHYVNVRLK